MRPSLSWTVLLLLLGLVAALALGLGSLLALAALVCGIGGPGRRWLRVRTSRKRTLRL